MNYEALAAWRRLDLLGRNIDGFSGVPQPLRIEAIENECKDYADPVGLKWRIVFLEENIFSKRIKKYNADAARRNKSKK